MSKQYNIPQQTSDAFNVGSVESRKEYSGATFHFYTLAERERSGSASVDVPVGVRFFLSSTSSVFVSSRNPIYGYGDTRINH